MLTDENLIVLDQVLVGTIQLLHQVFVDIFGRCFDEHRIFRFHILLAYFKRLIYLCYSTVGLPDLDQHFFY